MVDTLVELVLVVTDVVEVDVGEVVGSVVVVEVVWLSRLVLCSGKSSDPVAP